MQATEKKWAIKAGGGCFLICFLVFFSQSFCFFCFPRYICFSYVFFFCGGTCFLRVYFLKGFIGVFLKCLRFFL